METTLEMITEAQIKKIWYESKQLGLSEDVLYEVVETLTDKKHLHDLTKKEGILLIDLLLQHKRDSVERPGMATSRQLWKIEQLRQELGWHQERLRNHIKKYSHVEHLMWLDAKAASDIITGMVNIQRQMKNKKIKESEG